MHRALRGAPMNTSSTFATSALSCAVALALSSLVSAQSVTNSFHAHDPGVRTGSIGAGLPLANLSAAQQQFFSDGFDRFVEVDSVNGAVAGAPGRGLGPGYNATSCGACHAQPFAGGTSPSATIYPYLGANPQIAAASAGGASNAVPSFIAPDGPVLETRFPFVVSRSGALTSTPDGGVHDIYTIAGRGDAPGC